MGWGNVTSSGGASITDRGVAYGISQNPTIDGSTASAGSGLGSFVVNITGLQPGVTYYVRAYATNIAGTAYGSQVSFKTELEDGATATVTDIDGNTYRTVVIGDKWWMAENLKTTRYRNGIDISYPGSNDISWQNNTSGAYAWYDNDISNKDIYGALYNWHAVNNSNGLCPAGWRVPSDDEWTDLTNYLMTEYSIPNNDLVNGAGNALKSCRQLESPLGGICNTSEHPRWNSSSTHFGIDKFGFSALPVGYRNSNSSFFQHSTIGVWWSSTEINSESVWNRLIDYNAGHVNRSHSSMGVGFSVRCIKNLDN